MKRDCKTVFDLTNEDKILLKNTMYMLETIANAMDDADSYNDVTIVNDDDIDDNHDFGDCVDEIFDYSKIICNYLSHQSW